MVLDSPDERECFSPPGFQILSSPLTSPSSERKRKTPMSSRPERPEKKTDLNEGRWSWADEGILTSPRSKVFHHRKVILKIFAPASIFITLSYTSQSCQKVKLVILCGFLSCQLGVVVLVEYFNMKNKEDKADF